MLLLRALLNLRSYPKVEAVLGVELRARALGLGHVSDDEMLARNPNLLIVAFGADRLEAFAATLATLESDLVEFAGVPGFDELRQRLLNLEGTQFLASMSELALARHLVSQGWSVQFNAPFTLRLADGRTRVKDVDLLVRSPGGEATHVEVFSAFGGQPITNTRSGFLDIQPDGFAKAIERKLRQKFGDVGDIVENIDEGPLVLAIDASYNHRAAASLVLPTDALLHELAGLRSLGRPVSRILLFRHLDHIVGHPLERPRWYYLCADGTYRPSPET